jgi:hypothetical protein
MDRQEQAQQAYKARQNTIAEQIAQLEAELKIHKDRAEVEGINFAHVGDLAHVYGQLEDIVFFMQDENEPDSQPLASGKGWVVADV